MREFIKNEIFPIAESILSLKLKTHVLLATTLGGFTIGMLTGLVEDWIYDPAASYYALICLIFGDHLTGMYLAWKGNRFETKKAMRIGWTLIAHTTLLMGITHVSREGELFSWMNEAVFVPLVLVNFISLAKNMALLGWIKKEFLGILYNKIDEYKNQYQIKKDDKNDNGLGGM